MGTKQNRKLNKILTNKKQNIMKNKFKFLAMMLIGILLSVNVAWGGTFTKITNVSEIKDGDNVIIAIQDGQTSTTGKALKEGVSDNAVDFSPSGSSISNPDAKLIWNVSISNNSYKFTNSNHWVRNSSSATITSTTNTKGNEYWSITKLSDGLFRLDNTSTSRYMSYNGNAKFAAYLSDNFINQFDNGGSELGQYCGAISIFKEESCTTDLDAPEVTATPGNGSATLTWAAVPNATKYQVSWNGGAYADATSPYVKNSLTNDVTYTWKVKAIGGDEYCDSEEASGNVTPSANHTVTWYVDGEVYTEGSPTTEVADGGKVTELPTPPDVPDACAGSAFVGWTASTTTNFGNTPPSDLFKDVEHAPAVTEDVTYHAVFADPE